MAAIATEVAGTSLLKTTDGFSGWSRPLSV
jgi:multidrug transporter EmrE-like cation transporter